MALVVDPSVAIAFSACAPAYTVTTKPLIADAFKAFPATHGQAQAEVGFFLRERLTGYLREDGYSAQEVEAVVEARPERWAEVPKRLAAVRAFAALPEAQSLAAANKRGCSNSASAIEPRPNEARPRNARRTSCSP